MKTSFPYLFQEQNMDTLSVTDIGNCCIVANNDLSDEYILVIRTQYGVSRVLEYGPYNNGMLKPHCECIFDQLDYNENKLCGRIGKFLNQKNRCITQAEECEYESVKEKIISPVRYLYYEEQQTND